MELGKIRSIHAHSLSDEVSLCRRGIADEDSETAGTILSLPTHFRKHTTSFGMVESSGEVMPLLSPTQPSAEMASNRHSTGWLPQSL